MRSPSAFVGVPASQNFLGIAKFLGQSKVGYNLNVPTATRFKQHVTSSQGVCGGRPCIAGTRIRVSDVAALAQSGHSPDEILANFPRLKLADVHAALAYYYDNKEAIDRATAGDKRFAQSMRRKMGPGLLVQKRIARADSKASRRK
jgi:uncharacterized protein (DUF433 family)